MPVRNYNNLAPPVALTVLASESAVSLTVASTAGYPSPPFIIGVERGTGNEEVCLVTASTATTFTVTRGYDGTTPKEHEVGAAVEHCVAAIDYRDANEHINNTGLDEHAQYMRSDGTRHDLAARHVLGVTIPVGVVADIAALSFGTAAVAGGTGKAADAGHRHALPSVASLRDSLIPAGAIWPWGGLTAPDGFVLCDGGVYSSAAYPSLSAVLAGRYNTGSEGAGNFRVPDLRSRMPVGYGQGSGLSMRNLGGRGGAEAVVLGPNELAIHNHGVSDPGHAHGVADPGHSHVPPGTAQWVIENQQPNNQRIPDTGSTANGVMVTYTRSLNASGTGISIYAANTGVGTFNAGGGGAHENMPPWLTVNFIIKAH